MDEDGTVGATQAPLGNALSRLDAIRDLLAVKRVFGEAYQVEDATIIPVAAIRGGGGGGGGEGSGPGEQGAGSGTGVGFGVHARPVGVFVVKGGTASWSPAVDVIRIALGGQLIALVAVWMFGRVLRHRHRRR